jgi:DNA-directed RNA polymerase subunit E'
MFYKVTLKDTARIPPRSFGMPIKEAIISQLKTKYESFISKNLGIVIDVLDVHTNSEGIIIPGDGAAFYDVEFEVLAFRLELQEVVTGRILDIADFGAFMNIGPVEGMIHVSQTMDDFVSVSDGVLQGRDSNRALKSADLCRARVIAVSFKDLLNPKFGLTMRQPNLGKLDWIKAE